MRNIISLCLTLFLCIGICPTTAFASNAPSIKQSDIVEYTVDDAGTYKTTNFINGIPYLNLYDVANDILATRDINYDTGKMTFTYANHTVTMTHGDKTAYVDGEPITLAFAPVRQGQSTYVTIDTISKLFDQKTYIRTRIAAKDQIRTVDGIDHYVYRAGDEIAYYDIAPNPGAAHYTSAQLTFMQGLSCPIFYHNLTMGPNPMDATDTYLQRRLDRLRPVSGITRTWSYRNKHVKLLKDSWGVTTREQLIRHIEALIRSGNSGSKASIAYDNSRAVQLAQMGYLTGMLTAEETIIYGMKAARRAQMEFSSWQDYGTSYLEGAQYYLGSMGLPGRTDIVNYLYEGNTFLGVGWGVSLDMPPFAG